MNKLFSFLEMNKLKFVQQNSEIKLEYEVLFGYKLKLGYVFKIKLNT